MKDRIKRYCAESGLPSKEEIVEYHQRQFLKEVSRDLKIVSSLERGQDELQLIKLRAIEETPF